MKIKLLLKTTALLLSLSVLFNSCIGSFQLTQKLYAWNRSADNDKWVNELIFIALSACQVYTIAVVIDSIVLNSIEFWTGENPAADTQKRQIKTEEGIFTISSNASGHKIQKEGSDEIVTFHFNAEENSWSVEAMGQSFPLLQFTGENQAKVYLADGSTITVNANEAKALALESHQKELPSQFIF